MPGTSIASSIEYWAARDPIRRLCAPARGRGLIAPAIWTGSRARPKRSSTSRRARVIDAPWPEAADAGRRRVRGRGAARACRGAGSGGPAAGAGRCRTRPTRSPARSRAAVRSEGPHVSRSDHARHSAMRLRADPRVFVYGEDVGGKYGNAFLLLRPLLDEFGDRIINSPLAEGAVLGVCVGAALAGQRPIGEMQFNDFVATGFNQLVNNAAKIRYRWGGERADGRAHAVGRPAARRPVSLAEHRSLVLSHAGTEDRRAVDAARRAGAVGVGGGRSRSGPVLRAHRALSRSAHQAGLERCRRRRPDSARPRGAPPRGRRPRDRVVRRVRPRRDAGRRRARRRRHRGERARPAHARAARPRGAAGPGTPVPQGAHRS